MSSIIEDEDKLAQQEASKSFELGSGAGGGGIHFEEIAEDED